MHKRTERGQCPYVRSRPIADIPFFRNATARQQLATDRPVGKRRLWGCITFALAALVAVVVFYAFDAGYLPVKSFDATRWREAAASDNPPVRLQMIDSLMRSRRIDNLTRSQVDALLGPPNGDGYFADWDLVYWLGPERGWMRIDSEWLVIRFGPSGRVTEYRIVRD